jgi:hypothetical protein
MTVLQETQMAQMYLWSMPIRKLIHNTMSSIDCNDHNFIFTFYFI